MLTKLRALVLSQDRAATVPLETAFGISGVASEIHDEQNAAGKALSQKHFDGIIVDCDFEPATKLIGQIRVRSNRLTPLVTLTSSMEAVAQSRHEGANLILRKPLTILRVGPYLKAALRLMSQEHLRYQRYPVNRPALLGLQDGRTFQARTINVSRDGLALQLSNPATLHNRFLVRFDLPTKHPLTISANAEPMWSDQQGRIGLHFVHMSPAPQQLLQQALAELHHDVLSV